MSLATVSTHHTSRCDKRNPYSAINVGPHESSSPLRHRRYSTQRRKIHVAWIVRIERVATKKHMKSRYQFATLALITHRTLAILPAPLCNTAVRAPAHTMTARASASISNRHTHRHKAYKSTNARKLDIDCSSSKHHARSSDNTLT